MLRVALNAWGFVALLVIAGGANICLSLAAFAEGKCPPGQTDKLKKYKGVCMPIEAGRENAGESTSGTCCATARIEMHEASGALVVSGPKVRAYDNSNVGLKIARPQCPLWVISGQ